MDKADDYELVSAIPDEIMRHQNRQTGKPVLIEIDGIVQQYFSDEDYFLGAKFSEQLKAEQNWFEKLVTHAPSVGSFYEDALKAILSNVIPSSLSIASGFVYDPLGRRSSNQVDVLIFENLTTMPFYRRGDFAIVAPKTVSSITEIKKNLTLSDVRNIVEKFAL